MDYPERLLESLPIIALMRKDSLARIAPADTAIGPPSTTDGATARILPADGDRSDYAYRPDRRCRLPLHSV